MSFVPNKFWVDKRKTSVSTRGSHAAMHGEGYEGFLGAEKEIHVNYTS